MASDLGLHCLSHPPPPKKKKNIRPTCKCAKYQLLMNGCRYKLECVHGARTPPLMQSSYILTKPKIIFDEQRAITLRGSVRYSSLSKLKKTLWTKFYKVVMEVDL